MKYRKKPVVIDAWQFDGTWEGFKNILSDLSNEETSHLEFIPLYGASFNEPESGEILITTLEGEMTASEDDFIIKGVAGELYPCKPDIFKKTYDLA